MLEMGQNALGSGSQSMGRECIQKGEVWELLFYDKGSY